MAKILLTWELGAGLGHLIQLLPLARGLTAAGHTVYAAMKDLSRVRGIPGYEGVVLLPAPTQPGRPEHEIKPPITFAHILHNVGIGNPVAFAGLAEGWRNICTLVRPDLVIYDHSPVALVATRGLGAKRVLIGSGFFAPPDVTPLPNLRPWLLADLAKLAADEERILNNINDLLNSWGQASIPRLSSLYAEVDENFLTTFPELDHYGARGNTKYWGFWADAQGHAPEWPTGAGKRVYAYLKSTPAVSEILSALARTGCPTVVSVDGIPPEVRAKCAAPNLKFESRRLDLAHVARECDAAVLNGNHGTTVYMLLAGKPTLQLPITLEQGLFARAVRRSGAGLDASHRQPEQVAQRLDELLNSTACAAAARAFAARHAGFDSARQAAAMLARVRELLSC